MKLPLNALRALAVVHSLGGVRAAAKELGIAHSSVSRHLAELESWLGFPLFEPTTGRRDLVFTARGAALGEAAGAGLRELEHLVDTLRDARTRNAVTLSTTPSFAARWLLPRLPHLESAHPQIQVSVLVDQRIDDLKSGHIDLAVRMGRGPWPGLRCEPLMDDRLYPVMSPAFHTAAGRPHELADLARLKLLHDRDPQATWEHWRQAQGPASLDFSAGPRLASSDLVLRAAAQGQGVALARHRLVHDDVRSGALLRPFGTAEVETGPAYWIVLPGEGTVRSATRRVIAWLQQQAEWSDSGP